MGRMCRCRLLFAWGLPLLMAICCLSAPAPPDADGDGLSDEQEALLGTDPQGPETWTLVFDDLSRAAGDRTVSTDNYRADHDLTRIYFGNVAEDRYLWVVEFAADYEADNAVLHIYLDADHNPQTGRQNGTGTEYMLTCINRVPSGTQFSPEGVQSPLGGVRVVIAGRRVFICADRTLRQEEGQAIFRMMVLSETHQPHVYVDSTPWFEVRGPGESKRRKIMLDSELTESQGVDVTWGFPLTLQLRENPDNVVIPLDPEQGPCQLQGFIYDLFTEYKQPSVRRTEAEGTIKVTVPVAGSYYPAVLLYDGRGTEIYRLSLNGEKKAVIVANRDDNRTYVFTLREPVTFQGGETLELRTLRPEGTYRTEDLLLLKEKPAPRQRKYEIAYAEAQVQGTRDHLAAGTKLRAAVTFITNWDVAAKVEYGLTAEYGQVAAETRPVNNHRIFLTDLEPNRTYHYRVRAQTDEGETVSTPDATFSTAPVPPPGGKVERATVPLHLLNVENLPATGFPVTSGVPFPLGALGSEGHVRLLDAAGQEVPLQTKVLARWPEGSIKWLLVDFQGKRNVTSPHPPTYTLEYGTAVRRAPFETPLQVEDDGQRVTITTGPLQIVLDRERGALFDDLRLDLRGDGNFQRVTDPTKPAGSVLIGEDGTEYRSMAAPCEITVEEAGPLRAVVHLRGTHRADDGRDLFAYEVRLHAYAGQSFFRVQHTFGNSRVEADFTSIRGLFLRLPLLRPSATLSGVPPKPLEYAFGGAGTVYQGQLAPHMEVELRQMYDDGYEFLVNGEKQARGERAPGWMRLGVDGQGATVAVRDFWQLYPKALAVRSEGLEVALCPPLAPDQYEAREEPEYRLYYYLKGGLYKLRRGVTKTHEIWVRLEGGNYGQGDRERGGSGGGADLTLPGLGFAAAPPQWYADSKVFGDIATAAQTAYPQYEEAVHRALEGYLRNREQNHEYGMLNFGDWWGERRINWGNIEYDTQHAFFLQFVRSGEWRFFRVGEEAELHNRDVDTVHYGPQAGYVYLHCIGHTGNYYPQSPVEGQGIPGGHFSVSHTWCEGHLEHYFLTGDRRSLETALRIADRYDTDGTINYDFTNCRVPGWHLILTLAVYRATNDPFYLNGARIIVERVLERQTPDGGWRRQLMPGHCRDLPRHRGNAGFMVGVLLSGLKMYHEITGDERVLRSIIAASHFMIDDMWVPQVSGFRYTSCPNTSAGYWSNGLLFEGMGYAYRHTHDPRLRQVLEQGMAALAGNIGSFGKSLSQQIRAMPQILFEMEHLKNR